MTIHADNLLLALSLAVDTREKWEHSQGYFGQSALLKVWLEALEKLKRGETIEVRNDYDRMIDPNATELEANFVPSNLALQKAKSALRAAKDEMETNSPARAWKSEEQIEQALAAVDAVLKP